MALSAARAPGRDLHARACALADRWAVAELEVGCASVFLPSGGGWLAVEPMLDQNRFGPEELAINREAIVWCLARGLVVQHPELPHLMQVVRRDL